MPSGLPTRSLKRTTGDIAHAVSTSSGNRSVCPFRCMRAVVLQAREFCSRGIRAQVASRRVASHRVASREEWDDTGAGPADDPSDIKIGSHAARKVTRSRIAGQECSRLHPVASRDSPTVYYARRDIAGPRATLIGIRFNRARSCR